MSVLGRNITVGFAKDNTRNANNTNSASIWIPHAEFSCEKKFEYEEDKRSYGVREAFVNQMTRHTIVEGKFAAKVNANTLAFLLNQFFGSTTSVQDGTTGAYTHTHNVNQNLAVSSMSIFFRESGLTQWRKAYGCFIDELTIKTEAGGDTSVEFTFKGLDLIDNASLTPSYPDSNVVRFMKINDLKAYHADTVALLADTGGNRTEFNVKSVEIKLKNNLLEEKVNATLPIDIRYGVFESEVKFDVFMNSSDFNGFHGVTDKAFRFDFVDASAPLIGTSTTLRPRIYFDCALGRIVKETSYALDERITSSITVQPRRSLTENLMTRAVSVTNVASY